MFMRKKYLCLFSLAFLLLVGVEAAPAVTLNYSDHEPLGNMRTAFLNGVLFPAIERESNGRVHVEPHWNGKLSISYDALKTVQDGTAAQITVAVPEYFMDAFPLHQIFKSFPVGPTRQEQVNFFRHIYEEVPALEREMESQGVHVIFIATGFPVAFFSTKPMSDLRDIAGQKWRSASFWHKNFLQNAGAVPITMPWGHGVFEALDNGSLDGLMVNIDSGYDLECHKVSHNIVVSPKLWLGHAYPIVMNRAAWDALPDEDQRAIERAAETAYDQLGAVMDAALPAQMETLRADGANVRLLSDEEVAAWEQMTRYRDIQAAWVKEQVEAGLADAPAVLEAVRRKLEDAISGATINVAELSAAVRNARDRKTEDGGYSVKAGTSYSGVWGLYIANVIFKDGKIVKILLDRIDKNNESSKEKHDNYGIKKVSSIGKDWWEQVVFFENWALANGIDAVSFDEKGHATNVDVISGATIGIDDLTRAVRDAIK